MGYDVHRLVEGRDLWLGGIKVEHSLGLDGHSDADVLIHAICDALLGAANMRDIGYHFPDNSNQYLNIDSKILLRKTVELIESKGYQVGNIDATICAEQEHQHNDGYRCSPRGDDFKNPHQRGKREDGDDTLLDDSQVLDTIPLGGHVPEQKSNDSHKGNLDGTLGVRVVLSLMTHLMVRINEMKAFVNVKHIILDLIEFI